MVTDFRVAVSFVDHPKVKRFGRAVGKRHIEYLVRLHTFIAVNKPTGVLEGMDAADIADAAGWTGEAEKLVRPLHELRLLDCSAEGSWKCSHQGLVCLDGATYRYHGWEDVNAWVVHSPDRSAAARAKANKRWGSPQASEKDDQKDAQSSETSNAQSNAVSNAASNAPFPLPFPLPPPPPFPLPVPPDGILSAKQLGFRSKEIAAFNEEWNLLYPGGGGTDADYEEMFQKRVGIPYALYKESKEHHSR